jgi:large subunit ribosomal protein L16
MLSPKRTKHRKQMRRWKNRDATRCNKISFGDYGLMSMETKWVTNRQIEAARIAMTRHIKRGGKVWIRLFPDKPYTKKPAETRMGKGKGSPEYWVATVQRGMIMFEINGVTKELAASAIRLAGNKLPIKTKFVMRRGMEQE